MLAILITVFKEKNMFYIWKVILHLFISNIDYFYLHIKTDIEDPNCEFGPMFSSIDLSCKIGKYYHYTQFHLRSSRSFGDKDHQRVMVDPMFIIVQSLRLFLTAVTPTASATIAVILRVLT